MKLYKNKRFWCIDVNNCVVTKTWGQVGGKTTSTQHEFTQGKNIGKKNETTPEQQALQHVQYCIKKYKDSGYREEGENRQDLPKPMLASTWNGKTKLKKIYVQPKLDGVRLIVGRVDGEMVSYSRTGKIMDFKIIKSLCNFLGEGEFLDGEVFDPNMNFSDITGAFRGPSENHDKIGYYCFDCFNLAEPGEPFARRLKKLESYKDIIVVPTRLIKTCDLNQVHNLMSKDYEGTMIRDPQGKYDFDKRSKGLMKLKDFHTSEYPIIGWDTAKDDTVIWKCKTQTDQEFSVRPKGTVEMRRKWLENASSYVGKLLTVQYQETTTKHNVPRFPVGLEIRDYE